MFEDILENGNKAREHWKKTSKKKKKKEGVQQ